MGGSVFGKARAKDVAMIAATMDEWEVQGTGHSFVTCTEMVSSDPYELGQLCNGATRKNIDMVKTSTSLLNCCGRSWNSPP
jgi:hypothetical protein